MNGEHSQTEFAYTTSHANSSHAYLLPAVRAVLAASLWVPGKDKRIFEIGCGNGAIASQLSALGYSVTGIDTSRSGIEHANTAYPQLSLAIGSVYESLTEKYGKFPVVLSLEVIEHLYNPNALALRAFELLEDGGTLILSTPYHGYLKNVVLALTGRLDDHFTSLWNGGHIKFFSMRTLLTLLSDAGFENIRFVRVGRIPPLAKSMIAIAAKPARKS